MAKGSPTADENANFGLGAAPGKTNVNPKIMAGASMTKAPKGLADGKGWWAPNDKLPAGVTAQWVPPTPAAVAAPTVAPTQVANRNLLAEAMGQSGSPGGVSHGDQQGATTSGSNWGGSSSANSGYGPGGGGYNW